jgi:hypothetical protein
MLVIAVSLDQNFSIIAQDGCIANRHCDRHNARYIRYIAPNKMA